jgi:16S rRNA processing protein RimM
MAAPSGHSEGGAGLRVGEIVGAHGLKGEVRLRSFAATSSKIMDYSPLATADGRACVIVALRPLGGASPEMFVARIAGIADREAAQALAGTTLHVARERVRAELTEAEFLHADLIGCRVELDGEVIGKVVAVQNFGAGDLIEIALQGARRTEFVPFAEAFVPVVDVPGRKIVIAAGLIASKA